MKRIKLLYWTMLAVGILLISLGASGAIFNAKVSSRQSNFVISPQPIKPLAPLQLDIPHYTADQVIYTVRAYSPDQGKRMASWAVSYEGGGIWIITKRFSAGGYSAIFTFDEKTGKVQQIY